MVAQLREPWARALRDFDADLRRRAVATKTRDAYAGDIARFGAWCEARELAPGAVEVRDLRRYAASLTAGGLRPTSVARAVGARRAFYRGLRERGVVAQNPAELLTLPKRPRTLPHVLRPDELATLLDRIGAATPLERRDRAMFELAYSSGLRAEELVTLTVDSLQFDDEQVRVEGKGRK